MLEYSTQLNFFFPDDGVHPHFIKYHHIHLATDMHRTACYNPKSFPVAGT